MESHRKMQTKNGAGDDKNNTPSISDIFKPICNLPRTPERSRSDSNSAKRARENSTPEEVTPVFSVPHNGCEVFFQEIKSLLLQNTATINEIKSKVDNLDNKLSGMAKEISELKNENETLKTTNLEMQHQISCLTEEIEKQELYSRKNNLIFHHLPVIKSDSERTCEMKVKEFVKSEIGIVDTDSLLIDIAHVLPSRSNFSPPVIVKFTKRTDRNLILNAYRAKNKIPNSSPELQEKTPKVRISEDFTRRVRFIRSNLIPIMKSALNEGKRVKLRTDRLCIENQWFTYNLTSNQIINVNSIVNQSGDKSLVKNTPESVTSQTSHLPGLPTSTA